MAVAVAVGNGLLQLLLSLSLLLLLLLLLYLLSKSLCCHVVLLLNLRSFGDGANRSSLCNDDTK